LAPRATFGRDTWSGGADVIAERLTLLFDADDTLWENNILFERVIADYFDWLRHPALDHATLRNVLNDVERANTAAHGYGSEVFLRTLHDTFARLNARATTQAESAEIVALADDLVHARIELVPGVADVLAQLGSRHDLRLVTKGAPAEQQAKLDASGLREHFASVHILREKNRDAYEALVADLGLDRARTWMIGNSPKSDIRPAREAGLRAVFIPNENTWVLEHAELDERDPGVLTLPTLASLLEHF
jgi:putative hydrolase of the HAD superfamily